MLCKKFIMRTTVICEFQLNTLIGNETSQVHNILGHNTYIGALLLELHSMKYYSSKTVIHFVVVLRSVI